MDRSISIWPRTARGDKRRQDDGDGLRMPKRGLQSCLVIMHARPSIFFSYPKRPRVGARYKNGRKKRNRTPVPFRARDSKLNDTGLEVTSTAVCSPETERCKSNVALPVETSRSSVDIVPLISTGPVDPDRGECANEREVAKV